MQVVILVLLVVTYVAAFPYTNGPKQCTYYKNNYKMTTSTYTTGVDIATCTPGKVTPQADTDMLRVVNMFRNLTNIGPVRIINHKEDTNSQECALMCAANNVLQHTDWSTGATCYTSNGAAGCGSSNLAEGLTVPNEIISLWVSDVNGGSNYAGHRRWVLSPTLGGISFGLAGAFSSLYVFGTQKARDPSHYSWPPAGITPLAAVASWGAIDWQYADKSWTGSTLDIVSCTVVDSTGANVLSGACYYNGPGYGPWGAIFMPFSVINVAGCYTVKITWNSGTGSSHNINYTSKLWDCAQKTGGNKCLAA